LESLFRTYLTASSTVLTLSLFEDRWDDAYRRQDTMGDGRLGLQAAGGDSAACPTSDAEQVRRIEKMPKEVGLFLINDRERG